jgi:hypothetical protein
MKTFVVPTLTLIFLTRLDDPRSLRQLHYSFADTLQASLPSIDPKQTKSWIRILIVYGNTNPWPRITYIPWHRGYMSRHTRDEVCTTAYLVYLRHWRLDR